MNADVELSPEDRETGRRFLTVPETAERLRTTPQALYNMRHRGDGPPAIRHGRKLLYAEDDLDAYIDRLYADQAPARAYSSGPSPAVTCIMCVHMKGDLTRESLDSVLAQTRLDDVHLLVVDSGQWRDASGVVDSDLARQMEKVHAEYSEHPNIEWTFTGEGPDLAETKCPVGWATNQAIRQGLVRGRYVCTFYDDDRYHPMFMERMAGYLDDHPDTNAVWCSQRRVALLLDGREIVMGAIPATGTRNGGVWDCQVDGGQVMWRREMFDLIGDPWLPEEPSTCYHSDGLFLNKLGAVAGPVPGIAMALCDNRKTPLSTFSPTRE